MLRLQLPNNRQAVSEETHGTHTQLSVAVAALAIAYKKKVARMRCFQTKENLTGLS